MNLDEVVLDWMKFAKYDMDAAQILSEQRYPKLLEIICYHCQQSAEKALKAFLIANEVDPPKIHDLNFLRKMCENIEVSFSEMTKQCEFLTKYGVAPKYPYEIDVFEKDSDRALGYAQIVYEKIEGLINNGRGR